MAEFSKMNDRVAQADQEIELLLTDEQKPLVAPLLKKLTVLRETGLPPELYCELKLTDESRESGRDRSRCETGEQGEDGVPSSGARPRQSKADAKAVDSLNEKVVAILTKEQKSLVKKYRKKHPQMISPMMGMDMPNP